MSTEHSWAWVGNRGRAVDYRCSDEGCNAVRTEVGFVGGLNCEHHGRQMISPCMSCASTPWRYGSDGRCEHTSVNLFGTIDRCALYADHAPHQHEWACASRDRASGMPCAIGYAHPGDNHASHDGRHAWWDGWIGPPSRKTDVEWKATPDAQPVAAVPEDGQP